jgi:hypothetical protein
MGTVSLIESPELRRLFARDVTISHVVPLQEPHRNKHDEYCQPTLGSEAQPPIQWVPGREADHSPTSGVQVKKTWIYTSTPHTPSWCSA